MGRPSMTVIRVSQQELDRLKVLVELGDGRLGIDAAATVTGADSRARRRSRTNLLMARSHHHSEITPFIPLRFQDRTI